MSETAEMLDLDEVLPQFCPECGSGPESTKPTPPGYARVYRVPADWHLHPPCPECVRRDKIRMMRLGRDVARRRNELVLAAVLANGLPSNPDGTF